MIKKIVLTATAFILTFFLISGMNAEIKKETEKTKAVKVHQKKISGQTIQVAILLDTSNSMDGLINQAKSTLWNIINTITTLKYNGEEPNLEIALYQYGNDGLNAEKNYIKQEVNFTQDLDLISEKLFGLITNGGEEYCGAVIQKSIQEMDWKADDKALKLIYIAGNEAFNQGPIDYKSSLKLAKDHQVYVNTIFCGRNEEGISSFWQDGAISSNGKYFSIDSNQKVKYIDTPYDVEINQYNTQLNDTYIGYGSLGRSKKTAQARQDINAAELSEVVITERVISKSKKNAYKNTSWDVVDKYEEDAEGILDLKDTDLPKELQGKTKEEKEKYILKLKSERDAMQKKIAGLSIEREKYIAAQAQNSEEENHLGEAIKKSVIELAEKKGFSME